MAAAVVAVAASVLRCHCCRCRHSASAVFAVSATKVRDCAQLPGRRWGRTASSPITVDVVHVVADCHLHRRRRRCQSSSAPPAAISGLTCTDRVPKRPIFVLRRLANTPPQPCPSIVGRLIADTTGLIARRCQGPPSEQTERSQYCRMENEEEGVNGARSESNGACGNK